MDLFGGFGRSATVGTPFSPNFSEEHPDPCLAVALNVGKGFYSSSTVVVRHERVKCRHPSTDYPGCQESLARARALSLFRTGFERDH
jgi:hypothetical protein